MLISVGNIISKSVDLYKKNTQLFLTYVGVMLIPNALIQIITATFFLGNLNFFILGLLTFLAGLANIWISLAFIRVVAAKYVGAASTDIKDELLNVKNIFLAAIIASLLAALAIFAGVILLIIPGIIVAVWFAFGLYAVAIDNKDGVEALKASKQLVQGRWWAVFWRLVAPAIVFGILTIVVQGIGELIFGSLGNAFGIVVGLLGGVLVTAAALLVFPLSTAAPTILYIELKKTPVANNPAPATKA